MFGIYGMAEAVSLLLEKEGHTANYGHGEATNKPSYIISEKLAQFVAQTL